MSLRTSRSRISSESLTEYGMSRDDSPSDQRAREDRIIADALAILDSRVKRGETMADPDAAGAYCKLRLQGREREAFACLFLDTRHRVIEYVELFHGTIDGSEVHPREVVRVALRLGAAAVIFAHNHPSGNPDASVADRAVTARLKSALELVAVRVLDHFIIGDGAPTSMARRGWV